MYSKASFTNQLKAILDKRGMSQRDLAIKLNTTEATVSRYVNGTRTPTIDTVVSMAEALNVSINDLVGVETPATAAIPADVKILMSCYSKANDAQRDALWSIIGSYGLLSPDQKALLEAFKAGDTAEAV